MVCAWLNINWCIRFLVGFLQFVLFVLFGAYVFFGFLVCTDVVGLALVDGKFCSGRLQLAASIRAPPGLFGPAGLAPLVSSSHRLRGSSSQEGIEQADHVGRRLPGRGLGGAEASLARSSHRGLGGRWPPGFGQGHRGASDFMVALAGLRWAAATRSLELSKLS